MLIKKIINNNIASVTDERGRELIVSGKGIGFGKKPGDAVKREDIRKIYKMTGTERQRRLMDLLEEIPYEHLKVTEELIDIIKDELPRELNENLILTLSDHISFAIKRMEKGLEFSNPLLRSIKEYYPEEYAIGKKCIDHIAGQLGVIFNDDEAGTIAMHIVNSELNTVMGDVFNITGAIDDCVHIAESYYKKELDKTTIAFSRFCEQLRFFVQRAFTDTSNETEETDKEFVDTVKNIYAEHYRCAQSIASYIRHKHKKRAAEEELAYLAIELKRVISVSKNSSIGNNTE